MPHNPSELDQDDNPSCLSTACDHRGDRADRWRHCFRLWVAPMTKQTQAACWAGLNMFIAGALSVEASYSGAVLALLPPIMFNICGALYWLHRLECGDLK